MVTRPAPSKLVSNRPQHEVPLTLISLPLRVPPPAALIFFRLPFQTISATMLSLE